MIKLTIAGGQAWEVFRTAQGRMRRSLGARGSREAFLSSQLWQKLGEYAITVIRARLALGIGSNDQAMPPLKRPRNAKSIDAGYPGFKRRLGLKPIRDLYGPGGLVAQSRNGKKSYLRSGSSASRALIGGRGHMLDDLRVNAVSESGVSIDITNRASRAKARANEAKAAWIGFSRADRAKIMVKFGELFKAQGLDATALLQAFRGMGRSVVSAWRSAGRAA